MGIFDQAEYEIRCEWGPVGVEQLAPISDAVVIVDVLSFTTCVDIAVGRGATVFPCLWKDERAAKLAKERNAVLAGRRGEGAFSLSPASLATIPQDMRLVLPSPNGSTLSMATGSVPTFAGCLRNAAVVAAAAAELGPRIAVIAAGERWHDGDSSLRPAIEDWLGAGAIIAQLPGRLSPEAQLAAEAFKYALPEMAERIAGASSGKELVERGFGEDVALASQWNVSNCAPRLSDGAYVDGRA
ncbi:MAG: 2-phosphosulfolactate phosphatase [Candidatus Latescibacterota bacterium]|jgi:2-phosphosulfolactate phosphatase